MTVSFNAAVAAYRAASGVRGGAAKPDVGAATGGSFAELVGRVGEQALVGHPVRLRQPQDGATRLQPQLDLLVQALRVLRPGRDDKGGRAHVGQQRGYDRGARRGDGPRVHGGLSGTRRARQTPRDVRVARRLADEGRKARKMHTFTPKGARRRRLARDYIYCRLLKAFAPDLNAGGSVSSCRGREWDSTRHTGEGRCPETCVGETL